MAKPVPSAAPAIMSETKCTRRNTRDMPILLAQIYIGKVAAGKKWLTIQAIRKPPAVCPEGKLNSSEGL